MNNQTETDAQAEAAKAKKAFGAPMASATEDYDLLAQIPTLAVGTDIVAGDTIAGNFVALERLTSAKFTLSKERDEETGLPVSYRFILSRGGQQVGIWATGELKLLGRRLAVGTPISMKYMGKEVVNENAQHTFEFKTGKVPTTTMNYLKA